MRLSLEAIGKTVGPQTWLHPQSIAPRSGAVTVLLGATQAGKTSLMRIMAGLDVPTTGRVTVDGVDVTGVPVRRRNVAMVYQQFINYPSLTVADNIASPLRLRGDKDIDARVRELADRMHIGRFLDRLPAELSGGQQQRVALARALAKNAPLMLLDEPLVNLDYKLREGLREELTQLFASGDSTVIYATTEPGEALLLGGWTAVMEEGELLQYGPTADVFHRPLNLRVARAFSDPPMNLIAGETVTGGVRVEGGAVVPIALPDSTRGHVTIGLRSSALAVGSNGTGFDIAGRVELAEISGSDSFVHVATPIGELVAQLPGVHRFEIGASIALRFDPARAYVFGGDDRLLHAPARPGSH